MIRYPARSIKKIGVTAPSSGVEKELHELIRQSAERQQERGFDIVIGDTVWTQQHAKSAPAPVRAEELMRLLKDEAVDFVMPPWGGELLLEILEHLNFEEIPVKWIQGYSDTSVLLLAVTLKTGIATAHGTNFIDIRGEKMDETTARFWDVLNTRKGGTVVQHSSARYQKAWQHDNPSSVVFHLTEKTEWKTVSGRIESFSGRLLGGCIDVIRHLIGTSYGNVEAFLEQHMPGEPIIWFLENCELSTTDLRRSLVQMKYAGWFDNCAGMLFGRSPANQPTDGYTAKMLYEELSKELNVPVVFDIDVGHVPPQLTFVNGAFADVNVENGAGTIVQTFKA